MANEILDLVVKAKWYDLIKDGYKREEYRAIKPYWCNRLLNIFPIGESYWTYVLNDTFKFVGKPEHKSARVDLLERLLIGSYGIRREYRYIRFRRGYTKESMLFKIDSIEIGLGESDLGAPAEEVFIIKFSDYGSNKR